MLQSWKHSSHLPTKTHVFITHSYLREKKSYCNLHASQCVHLYAFFSTTVGLETRNLLQLSEAKVKINMLSHISLRNKRTQSPFRSFNYAFLAFRIQKRAQQLLILFCGWYWNPRRRGLNKFLYKQKHSMFPRKWPQTKVIMHSQDIINREILRLVLGLMARNCSKMQ